MSLSIEAPKENGIIPTHAKQGSLSREFPAQSGGPMPFKKVLLLSLALVLPMNMKAAEISGRQRLSLDADWRFHLGPIAGSEVDNGYLIPSWRYLGPTKTKPTDEIPAGLNVNTTGSQWKTAANGQDVFNQSPGFAWYRTDLPNVPGPHRILHFSGVDDNGTVYVNGHKMLYHEGWNDSFDINLDSVWKDGGPNQLAVLVENTYAGGNIKETYLLTLGQEEKVPPVVLDETADKDWAAVHLPHDFVVEGTFDPKGDASHGFLPTNTGWYRKTFEIPAKAKGKSLWIDFDGIYRDSRVWLNGKPLGRHLSGYTSFRYDIKDAAIIGGKNILTVHVDARNSEGWWYEGGGIYRHVWLNIAEPLHVAPWGTYVTAKPQGNSANLALQTTLENKSDSFASFKLVSEIKDARGKTVLKLSTPVNLAKGNTKTITQRGHIPKANRWSLENPYLYRWVTLVEQGKKPVDQVETSFGVRSFRFDANKGFFLNDKPVKIKGTCNHQDFAGIGIAIPDRLFTYRLEKLKEMGSNAYRCSHNPPAPELLDACDRLGILVMDENRRLGDSEEILNQLESMVLRDRNHPSVFLWSICNEESVQGKAQGKARGLAMKNKILSLDKTRLVSCAMNYGWGPGGLSDIVDLQGFNYAIDMYDLYHAKHPKVPLYGSETASTVSTRGIYETDRTLGYVSAYDVNHTEWAYTAEAAWRPIAERPWMAGGFVWTGFDYRGEPTPYAWPCINSHFGILDMCGFPKDNFYYYQAWWSDKPVLHLFPHWNWKGKEGKQVDVWCHTNYDLVELFLNGKSQGKQETPKNGHLEWKVWYEPGVLTAKAYKKGVYMTETKVETTGEPASIRLTPYNGKLVADGEDATPITVEILDDQGRVVPTADNPVAFTVTGAGHIAGVANGDPSSHEPDKAGARKAFNGLCMAILQTEDGKTGDITLTATSPNLKSAAVTISSVPQ